MASTTSKRLRRVWELLEGAEEYGAESVRTVDLRAVLEGKEPPLPEGLTRDFPFAVGDFITPDNLEFLHGAPVGTRIQAGPGDTAWAKIPGDHWLADGESAMTSTHNLAMWGGIVEVLEPVAEHEIPGVAMIPA